MGGKKPSSSSSCSSGSSSSFSYSSFWSRKGKKRNGSGGSRGTRLKVSDISWPLDVQTSNPIGNPYVSRQQKIQELPPPPPPHQGRRQDRCGMSFMCIGDQSRLSPLSPHLQSGQLPSTPHAPPLYPAGHQPPAKRRKIGEHHPHPGVVSPSQLGEWVPPAGLSLRTDTICYACERLPVRGEYGLCVKCAPMLEAQGTDSRFTVSDYARASFAETFERAIPLQTPTTAATPLLDMVAGPGRVPLYSPGTRVASQRAEHAYQYEAAPAVFDNRGRSQATSWERQAAREHAPAVLLSSPREGSNSSSGWGGGEGRGRGGTELHSEEVCIYLDSSSSPTASSSHDRSSYFQHPSLPSTPDYRHNPMASGTFGYDHQKPTPEPQPQPPPPPPPPPTGAGKAKHSKRRAHRPPSPPSPPSPPPSWSSPLQSSGLAASAAPRNRFMDWMRWRPEVQ